MQCPSCGMGLDVFSDHSLVCSCKGDRTLRHNALRDCAFRFVRASGLNPIKEKPGLLLPRPDSEEIRERRQNSGRRPADIWIPRWCDGGPAALDADGAGDACHVRRRTALKPSTLLLPSIATSVGSPRTNASIIQGKKMELADNSRRRTQLNLLNRGQMWQLKVRAKERAISTYSSNKWKRMVGLFVIAAI